MGIVVGATSGKFVMVAAILLFHARVDGDPVPAAIAPGAPLSALGARLARRLHAHDRPGAPIKIGIRGSYFYAPIDTANGDPLPDTELVIGQDILAAHPIELDFRRHELASLLPGELRARQRHDQAIILRPDGPDHWRVTLGLPNGGSVDARLDLTSPDALVLGADVGDAAPQASATVTLGGAALEDIPARRGEEETTSVGLGAFVGRRVIFDLAHDRIWIDA